MSKYVELVDELPPNPTKEQENTDWTAAEEVRQHPNRWVRIKVKRYTRCSSFNAKYAMKKLREQRLQADKREHYEELPPQTDPDTDEFIPVRKRLGVYSVYAMYVDQKEE